MTQPKITYDYTPVPTLEAFSDDNSFMRGLMGPFGSGKSSGCVMEIVQRAVTQSPEKDGIRRTRWAVIRNTYQQLNDTTIKTFLDWLPDGTFGRYFSTTHTFISDNMFPGVYFEVLFRALDRPDHVKNLLSLELTGAWVNEAREVPWAIIEPLGGRVGRYPAQNKNPDPNQAWPTWFGVFMDTNPPEDDSKWYHYFEEIKPSNAAIFKQPSGLAENVENIDNLPPNYYTNMAIGKTEDFIKVYIKGEYGYVQEGKPVYPEYNDNIHCEPCEVVKGLPIYRGWDFGLTPSCTFSQLTTSGRFITFDEMVADNMGIDRFSDDVKLYCGNEYLDFEFIDIGDPAGEQRSQTDEKTCFEILQAKGIQIEGGYQDPNIRIEAVKKPLNTMKDGKPMFSIAPKCKKLRRGFQGRYQYRRLQTSAEKYSDKPDKNEYSHPHDALQYVCTRLFAPLLKGEDKKQKVDYRKIYS